MTDQNSQVSLLNHNDIGIIEINYPPVNALSQPVRQGIVDGIDQFNQNPKIQAIIIRCAERTFIAGADIKEFGKPPTEPFLPNVVNHIEASNKPVIASLFGTTLGGGFEVALSCHYRVAKIDAKVGLPEVNLGLIPGAGGTQRLPRVVGISKALSMITQGSHLKAGDFAETNLFDALFDLDKSLNDSTIKFVEQLISSNSLELKRVGEIKVDGESIDWDKEIAAITKKSRGKEAPVVAANIIKNTCHLSINEGMKIEREAFLRLRESEQSAALRYVFGAEKASAKHNLSAEPLDVKKVGIVGGGNMGSGIATAFLNAGFQVCLVEQNQAALDQGISRITSNINSNVKRGRIIQAKADALLANLSSSTDYHIFSDCELVLEAIFEDLQVKKQLFAELEKVVSKNCILATNTSYLDINDIASVVNDPSRVIGMHFFSPAHIMKLLEVVKAEKSSDIALATAMFFGKKLKKMSVLVGVCFGFAGNRIYTRYGREIQQMLLEGATIEQIDKAMTEWGMAMGPLAVQDLSGIDIGHNARSAQPFPKHDKGYFRAAATMVENNRLGRKTGKGFYHYDETGKPQVDPKAQSLIEQKAKSLGIKPQVFTDEQIVERAIMALISEGIKLYKEGIVQRLSDIDVIWLHGYGFPRYKGGPIFQAKQMGKNGVNNRLVKLREKSSHLIWPDVDLSIID